MFRAKCNCTRECVRKDVKDCLAAMNAYIPTDDPRKICAANPKYPTPGYCIGYMENVFYGTASAGCIERDDCPPGKPRHRIPNISS